jgi:hypothetical protein
MNKNKRIIASVIALSASEVDNDVLTIPKRFVGLLKGLRIINADAGNARTLTVKDVFTPDASAGNASPSSQVVSRYKKVAAVSSDFGITTDEGDCICKLLGTFRLSLDVADADVSVAYTIELE